MSNKNTSIEINGRRYDALSGQLLHQAPTSIDGLVRPQTTAPVSVAATFSPSAPSRPLKTARSSSQPARSASRQAHGSATLMRHAVHKPSSSAAVSGVKTSVSNRRHQPSAAPAAVSIYRPDHERQQRAALVGQHPRVQHFSQLPAAPAKPPATAVHKQLSAASPAVPSPVSKLSLFEQALATATSHEQPAPSKKSVAKAKHSHAATRRRINLSAAALAVLLFAGFLAYQNVTNIKFKVAATKAGFAATMPGYHPAGFSASHFSYSPGNVAVNFTSNSDSRHFALLEQPSNWDSATLLNDFVASAGSSSYHTATMAGRTVYLYGQNDATWVNNGIWYQVHGNGSLTDAQLTSVAASM